MEDGDCEAMGRACRGSVAKRLWVDDEHVAFVGGSLRRPRTLDEGQSLCGLGGRGHDEEGVVVSVPSAAGG